ncbi:hypothetical protein EDD11_009469 [Mortierella claussenii]|nr:hypothetical protein EDD11_009469 [Mortierella claussenii]
MTTPTSFTNATSNNLPHVMIAGAGLGGLLLALLLEQAGIPYTVYERSQNLRALGSAMGFGANTLPILQQLGLLEEVLKISYPCHTVEMYDSHMKKLGGFDFDRYKERTGYDTIMFARPELHSLLRSRVPAEKILLGKRILSFSQDEESVIIKCGDGSSYRGDILVGADGAYSAVRQCLYQLVAKDGELRGTDADNLAAGHICMVGTTTPLDPKEYPALKDPVSHCKRIVANESKYSWSVATVPGNRICWAVILQLDAIDAKDAAFRNSEWGPESNASMIRECYHFCNPLGGVMGKLMDATPTDMISKVFLEDRMFETWYHGRTVLIGDGAQSAFQDAVVLANAIYEMPSFTHQNILAAFREYKHQRFGPATAQMDKSKLMGTLLYGQTWSERMTRYLIFNWVPKSIQTQQFLKDASYRPQCTYLPLVQNRGTVPVMEQRSSKKYAESTATCKAIVV